MQYKNSFCILRVVNKVIQLWYLFSPLQVPEGKVVVLSFRFIDLESDNLCRYDFVDVYNGHANGQRLGRFCGTFRPGALVANSNKMLVQMISDANTAGNGFVAKYSAAEPHERGIFQVFKAEIFWSILYFHGRFKILKIMLGLVCLHRIRFCWNYIFLSLYMGRQSNSNYKYIPSSLFYRSLKGEIKHAIFTKPLQNFFKRE